MQMMKLPGQGSGKNTYGIFYAAVSGGTHLKLFVNQFYELSVDGKICLYGPVRSKAPLFYYDEFVIPGNGEERTLCIKVHRRKGEPEFWCETSVPVQWLAFRLNSYDSNAPCNVGEVGYSEYLNCDAPIDTPAEPVPGQTYPDAYLHSRPVPYFWERELLPEKREEKDGEIIFDFGRIVSGRLEFSGHGRGSGKVRIEYIEDPNRGWAHSEGRKAMYADSFRGNMPEYRFKTFGKRGFRYAVISGDCGTIDRLRVLSYTYDTPCKGTFQCSDEDFNRLFQISLDTIRSCWDDVITDCPHRDQAQWMDAYVSSKIIFSCFGVSDVTAKCLLQHALCSFQDGKLLSPSICGKSDMPDYALVLWLFFRDYYHLSGDRETLEKGFENCRKSLEIFQTFQDSEGLLANRAGAYLDNTFELCRLGRNAALNALFFGALNAAAEIAEIIGKKELAEEWKQESKRVRQAFRQVFLKDGILRDSDSRPEQAFRNLNFSCEFGDRWAGKAGRAIFHFSAKAGERRRLLSAAYGPYRVILNGNIVTRDDRKADWSRPLPAYVPNETNLELRTENELRFEADCNPLNWDLYFHLEGEDLTSCEIEEFDPETGEITQTRHQTSARLWVPPRLSQTTYGYAAYVGLLNKEELEKSLTVDYFRNYRSIRVPRFSTETADPEKLSHWVMPPNTPWTMYYYLAGLFENGLSGAAWELLHRAWGVMLRADARNTFEEWSENASLCHAWGTAPVWFFQREILGVRLDRLWEKHIFVKPDLGGLQYARGQVAVGSDAVIGISIKRTSDGRTLYAVSEPKGFVVEIDSSRLKNPVRV